MADADDPDSSFQHYQEKTRETAIYPEDQALEYLALGLNGEAGEVAEKIKKYVRGDNIQLDTPEGQKKLARELGDVLWYLTRLVDELDAELEEVVQSNLDKLFDRQERGKLQGSGDNR